MAGARRRLRCTTLVSRSALQPYVAPLLRTLATDRSALLQLRRGALHLLQVVLLGTRTALLDQYARMEPVRQPLPSRAQKFCGLAV